MEEITVLVIEDNELNLKLVRSLLTLGQYQILEAANAEKGIELARDHHPDLILMDIQLPGMDGFTATHIIKEDPDLKEIPVMALTSYAMSGDEGKAIEAGCNGYMSKPIDTRSFLDTISRFIRHNEGIKPRIHRIPPHRSKSMETFSDRVSREDSPVRERELPSVLLVEDNEKDIRLIQDYLRGEPYNIILARNGEDAISLVQKKKVDIILLDIILPNIDGFEVASRLKEMEETKNIHIVFITAVRDVESKIKGIELGTSDFLTKPIDSRELRIRIRNALKNKALLDKLHPHYETALHSAITDGLTGLYNHAYFKRFLETEIKRSLRQKYPIALIMIDLDNFKPYNDTPGHLAGDHVLRETGQIIKKNIREVDAAARYGGEEFAVILPYTDKADAIRVAERLREAIGSHAFLEKPPPFGRITASFGIASYPADALTPEELIEKAVLMLYKARKEGKNKVCIYENQHGKQDHSHSG